MWSVGLSNAALDSLQSIPEEDRDTVFTAIGRLSEGPVPPRLPRPFRLRDRPDLLVLPAGRYRVAYTATHADEVITVIDIVAQVREADSPQASVAK
jgi:mRNA-degrading endonuclease RelE of RelBE toxin-antitoxin system